MEDLRFSGAVGFCWISFSFVSACLHWSWPLYSQAREHRLWKVIVRKRDLQKSPSIYTKTLWQKTMHLRRNQMQGEVVKQKLIRKRGDRIRFSEMIANFLRWWNPDGWFWETAGGTWFASPTIGPSFTNGGAFQGTHESDDFSFFTAMIYPVFVYRKLIPYRLHWGGWSGGLALGIWSSNSLGYHAVS